MDESDDDDMEDDDNSAESDSDSEESTSEDADMELRNKIEEALRSSGVQPATEDDSESEELLDDEQMMAIDEQLADVFKSRVDGKRKSVVSLVDIFSKLTSESRRWCTKRGNAL